MGDLSAPPRHQKLEVCRFHINHRFSGMGKESHDPQVIQFLLHPRLSKYDISLTIELFVVAALAKEVDGTEGHPPSRCASSRLIKEGQSFPPPLYYH